MLYYLSFQYEFVAIAFVFVLLLVVINLRRVPKDEAWIIEISGNYRRTIYGGVRFILFAAEKIAHKVNLTKQTGEIFLKEMHSKDKLSFDCKINFVYQIFDPKLFTYNKPIWDKLLHHGVEQITDQFDYAELMQDRIIFTNDVYRIINEKCVASGITLSKINFYIE